MWGATRSSVLGGAVLGLTALLATGCGSSSSGAAASGGGSTSAVTSAAGSAAATAAAAGSSAAAMSTGAMSTGAAGGSGGSGGAAAVTVTTKTGPLGTYLVDGSGRTLYLFVADKGTSSTCYGACAQYWPPLTGSASATGAAKSADLGTTKRTDGSTQVTYSGHPLYYFAGDKAAGDANGQGSSASGALWWVVGPDGKAITTKGGSGAASPTGSGYVKGY